MKAPKLHHNTTTAFELDKDLRVFMKSTKVDICQRHFDKTYKDFTYNINKCGIT